MAFQQSRARAPQQILVSTGQIPYAHDVIGPVFAYGSSKEGFLRTANPIEAYHKVTTVLQQEAAKFGADAVIFASFDYRVAVSFGCWGNRQVFEVFAYGTAVRFVQNPAPPPTPTGVPYAGVLPPQPSPSALDR